MVEVRAPSWRVGRSIAMELDYMLTALSGYYPLSDLSDPMREVAEGAPADWFDQWPEMLGQPQDGPFALALLAQIAGVLDEERYSEATLPMRELTLEDLLAWVEEYVAAYGLAASTGSTGEDRLLELVSLLEIYLKDEVGLLPASYVGGTRRVVRVMERMVHFVRGGSLHARFWHWMDRAYYEFYRAWREGQAERLDEAEQRAIAALGAAQAFDQVPDIAWLPPQHPFHIFPGVWQAVTKGRFPVYFWVQPFGLFDFLTLLPGVMAVSFDDATDGTERFRQRATQIAERTKALSDPTRLMILRIIRHFGMDNTQMADFLGLARPTVSIHAKVLREAGLIETRANGRAALHTVNSREVRRLFRDLERFLQLPEDKT